MIDKIAGLARLVATLLAIVAGFVAIPVTVNVALVLVILGLIAGLKYKPEQTVGLILVLVALPIVGSAQFSFFRYCFPSSNWPLVRSST